MLKANTQVGPPQHTVHADRIAVVGQSDGAISASAIGLNSCCIDTRVKAVVSIAGDKAFMPGTWVSSGTRPWLGIQGNADRALLRFGALADAGAFHLVADPPIR